MKIPNKKELKAMAGQIVDALNNANGFGDDIDKMQDANDGIYEEAKAVLLKFGIKEAELERDDIEDVITDLRNLVNYVPEHYEMDGK